MAINPTGATGVALTVFGGWVTEVAPEAVPENISPDCQDVSFAPGQVGSRPGLQKALATPLPSGGPNNLVPSVVYEKSFVTASGDVKNLLLDSNGTLYVIDLGTGVRTVLLNSTSGSYCRSITAFHREYLAISDGLHGTEVPLQYDGTYLDRVTQDGPGAPPSVVSLALPPSQLQTNAPGTGVSITSITPGALHPAGDYYPLTIVTATPHGLVPGNLFGVSGNSLYNIAVTQVVFVIDAYTFYGNWDSLSPAVGTGGDVYPLAPSLFRRNNVVTATTTSPHGLKVGYQAKISGAGSLGAAPPFGITNPLGITSIVVDNEDNPGIATVTTFGNHGMVPGIDVCITNVQPAQVGGGINSVARTSGSVTLTTNNSHKLVPGAVVQISGVTSAGSTNFNSTVTVATVPRPNQITYSEITYANDTGTGGTISVSWPVPDDTPTPTYFTVLSSPTSTTFDVQITYSDCTWTTGTLTFPWDGTFYVDSVPTSTSFTYKQYGPDGGSYLTGGTVTPFGQSSPGLHLMQVLFITRQGAITRPSPQVSFVANGGEYVSVAGIPTGPTNVVGRILAFTGAQPNVPGELPPFFYIPVPAQLEGQTVSTATQIDDNTTTEILLDFSDNSLFAALGISTPGNTLANQIVLDGALGLGYFDTCLTTWGQRNGIQNFLNMGFDGGSLPSSITIPAGWSSADSYGTLTTLNRQSYATGAWKITIPANSGNCGILSQGACLDSYGDPIVDSSLLYQIRAFLKPSFVGAGGPAFSAVLSSSSTGFTSTAVIPNSATNPNGSFVSAVFSEKIPVSVPDDLILTICASGSASTLYVTELLISPTETPYTETICYASYSNNPEGFDGDTGQYGPVNDTSKVMDQAILRDTLYILTRDPSGRLHQTTGSGVTGPSGWAVNEVAANCGTLSAFSLTHSQADDSSASGGDDWIAWASEGGVMIFGGGQPEKIMQEIQPNWNDPSHSDSSLQINMASSLSIWGLNDPTQRLLMFGVPIGEATAPNQVYVLNYEHLNSAGAIASSPPFHPSFAGKLIATDNARKWTHWFIEANGAARVYLSSGILSLVLFGGNGKTPGESACFGNVYTMNRAKTTDDDYGAFEPYYTTYFFLDPEKAQALQLSAGRILLAYVSAYCLASASVTIQALCDRLDNPWPLSFSRSPGMSPAFDIEGGGGQATGNRIALNIYPSAGGSFLLSRLTAYFKKAKMSVRGAAN